MRFDSRFTGREGGVKVWGMRQGYYPFPNTHWSLVRRAGWSEGESRTSALRTLLNRYWPALNSYLVYVKRLRGEEAEDVLQSFVADKFLEQAFIKHADERRGRFRTFLLACLNNFYASRQRSEGLRWTEGLDGSNVSERAVVSERQTQAIQFEAAWARALVRDVLKRMEEECIGNGRGDVWRVFEGRILRDLFSASEAVPYEQLAMELRLESPSQAANLLVTGKRMYARLLREAIAEYERDESAQEAEIDELCAILAQSPCVGDD